MTDFSLTEINERIAKESAFVKPLTDEIAKVIVGQNDVVTKILIGLLANGHILLEGVPGLAKTTIVKTIALLIDTRFQRIQFTPDMLPADLLGTLIYNQKTGGFETKKGPIFANIILADEINRSPAKVQSALLEAMQERQVTIGEETFLLDDPFLVFATQNPIEQEGTYPLPEAQVDRFMMKLKVDYPEKGEEMQILRRIAGGNTVPDMKPVVTPETIRDSRSVVTDIYVDEKIEQYAVDLVLATRNPAEYNLAEIESLIAYGGSPRATIYLILASKARAFLEGRGYVVPEDIRYIGEDILRHRIIPTYEAEAEEITPENLIQRLFDTIEVP
ncbi:MAG: MoxR family ATPase [Candidatus Marinimicrobia bacterium]|jgi:MoxR-like ATPase|nr:ATPase [Candidatus Neomarinimicrobiota bacterium]MDP6456866.1 MoxR family ATPase [Candidatus Neomarinimicrobiota bacterium]MDP6594115.1 MoxR family ATPase [Candidatus Neomarinimicrobiota bacterium]MDP6835593.1 MoxR family ATPase [Candidatus Neomarinimicrobiota bacterium]MDP6966133.1 MoxR family ATPase [Candidatus Neomarinimicrobiota bacterium]|tara:strand:+ start:20206 stop:21201 length:996 start_codon:yes stop_codon:yes gene_type:complete